MSLQRRIIEARELLETDLLVEGNAMRKPLLDTANSWRSFVRMGDLYLEAIQKVVRAAESVAAAEDPLTSRRANADVNGAIRGVVAVTGKAYGFFATGRTSMYEVAKRYSISTKRSSPKFGKKPTPLTMQSEKQVLAAMLKSAKGLQTGVRGMLDVGSIAQKEFRMAAAQQSDPHKEFITVTVNTGLDFRDTVSVNVFARTNGVMRRAAELSKRSWELMMLEGDSIVWSPPWAQDPEIGDNED